MLEIIRKLCQGLTGSHCSQPRLSNWEIVAPAQASVSVDVLGVATVGVAKALPANIKVYGSQFTCGLINNSATGGMSHFINGTGVGVGASIGFSPPFVGARSLGKMPNSIKRKVFEAIGGAAQGQFVDWLKNNAWGGMSGGTRLVAGPDARGDLTMSDFERGYATVVSLGTNYVVNGVSVGLVIFGKKRPILLGADLIHAKAIGLIAGVGIATSLDVEASGMFYRTTL
ncbi:MAG: hypothetical protein JWN04_3557 [Myxococcaceae bacterium]|nr:hypothetical protein [Myxococcaceae bacterium]